MAKSLIRLLAQILIVLCMVIGCCRYLFMVFFGGAQNPLSDRDLAIVTLVVGFIPMVFVASAIVAMPTLSNRFFVPDRLHGAACYLCATLRALGLLQLVNLFEILAFLLILRIKGNYLDGIWITQMAIAAQFCFWALLCWMAPWLSKVVVGQVDSGVMWYTRAWQSLKSMLNPE